MKICWQKTFAAIIFLSLSLGETQNIQAAQEEKRSYTTILKKLIPSTVGIACIALYLKKSPMLIISSKNHMALSLGSLILTNPYATMDLSKFPLGFQDLTKPDTITFNLSRISLITGVFLISCTWREKGLKLLKETWELITPKKRTAQQPNNTIDAEIS